MDDDPVNHMVLEGFLKPRGYLMEIKLSGQEALAYLEECELLPDIILLDWMMPGMSGLQVAQKVRAMLPDVSRNQISFLQDDALLADLSGASILYLTSLGWDLDLVYHLHDKLAKEMDSDAVIVANSYSEHSIMENFVIEDWLCVPTSWKASQVFYIYRKRRGTESPSPRPAQVRCKEDTSGRAALISSAGFVDVAVATLQESLAWLLDPQTQEALSFAAPSHPLVSSVHLCLQECMLLHLAEKPLSQPCAGACA